MYSLDSSKIAVLGFGIENQATVDWLLGQNASLAVYDEKNEAAFDAHTIARLKARGVSFHFGPFPTNIQAEHIVVSPGIRPDTPILHSTMQSEATVTTATNLFMERCPCPIIGVTGTKGKGTTSSLIYEMLKGDGKDAYLGGNIGTPPLSFLDKLTHNSIVILELSSFQLMRATKSPTIAVVLMVTSEHLDYHATIAEYLVAKSGIAKHQQNNDTIIVNADYPNSLAVIRETPGERWFVSNRGVRDENGCYVTDDTIILVENGVHTSVLLTSEVFLPGKHNLENVCAAVLASYRAGCSLNAIRQALKNFRGLEHRLELVREVRGVSYYNDSFSTTPESTIAAINAFTRPEILILGGSSKGSDFTKLAETIHSRTNIKAIIGIGDEWSQIKSAIGDTPLCIVEGLTSMNEIVTKASKIADTGDVVILSPACASFGMFKNYKDRGAQFKQAVMQL